MKSRVSLAFVALFVGGCVPAYTLKNAGPTTVAGGAFTVQPSTSWNLVPKDLKRTRWEEVWTQNGPLLDSVSFLGGLPEGKAIVVQKKKAEQQVPPFRADMSPVDLTSMIEASYRVNGVTVFNIESVDPVEFLGGQGLRLRFNYAPGNGMTRNGSCVLRVVDKKLYLMKLEGVSSHYFEAAVPAFDRLVATATLPR